MGYPKLWESVQAYEEKGLPKSALKVVEKINQRALKENNETQRVKSLIYKSKYALILEEDAQLNIINDFKNQIATSKSPLKNVLECILANLYWQYFQQNRYQFYRRTSIQNDASNVSNFKKQDPDFRTWSLQELTAEIHKRFQNALSRKELIGKIQLDDFDEILHLEENSKTYRPTLFDFIAQNALKYYKTQENSITQVANQFEISDKDFELVNDFEKAYAFAKENQSIHFHALKIYYDLLDFHKKSKNKDAEIIVEIERLKFVHNNINTAEKDDLLKDQLTKILVSNQHHKISSTIAFELANIHYRIGEKYSPEIGEYQFEKSKAQKLCKKFIGEYPESLGAKKCENLIKAIQKSSVSLLTEKHLPINKYGKILLMYNNLDSIHLSIHKINNKQAKNFGELKTAEKVEFIAKLEKVHASKHLLKNEQDFQTHSTEILIPPLENNRYLIVVTNNIQPQKDDFFATSLIQVTDFSLVQKSNTDKHLFQLVNRNTGKPISSANISLENEPKRNHSSKISERFKTDEFGEFNFKTSSYHQGVIISVDKNGEQAFFDGYYLNESRKPNINKEIKTTKPFIFTDRSIYRPGQTLHFKSILVEKTGVDSKIVGNKKVTATLFNANHEEVSSTVLKTNEFGSVSGHFILPSGGLTGAFRLMVKTEERASNSIQISVEAYKRPKFEVEFKPIEKTHRLNDSINVVGTATSYSGTNISNARVTYRVYRKELPRYRSYYTFSRPSHHSPKMEITHGEMITNNKGEFSIDFIAKSDSQIDKKIQPIFNYTVEADVTDLNGETRSAQTNIKIGYHTLQLSAEIDERVDVEKREHKIKITSLNLNDEKVKVKGKVRIYKLAPPNRVMRKRPWKAPDYQQFSKEKFEEFFPNETYHDDEQHISQWKKEKLVFEKQFDIDGTGTLMLSNIKNWSLGKFLLEVESFDRHQQKVTTQNVFSVFDSKRATVIENSLFEISLDKETYQPAENIRLKVGSSAAEVYVTLAVEKNQQIVEQQIIKLNNEAKFLDFKTTNKDLGGFSIKYSLSTYNQFDSGSLNIPIQKKQEAIEINIQTFRDKIEPGKKEQWSFSIKGNNKDKVAAELLASMYDASLDQFKPHKWQAYKTPIKTYYSYNHWNARNTFGNDSFRVYNQLNHYYSNDFQSFDRLNWFGLNFNNAYNNQRLMSSMIRKSASKGVQPMNMSINREASLSKMESADLSSAPMNEADVDSVQENSDTENPASGGLVLGKFRKNFNENAFFYPHLQTDSKGTVSFSFEAPETFTRWKLQLLAHTKNSQFAYKELETVTQKKLMIFPNLPRFVRHGDEFELRTKLSNLTNKSMKGKIELTLFDALSGEKLLKNDGSISSFTINASGNTQAAWNFKVPENIMAIQYKMVAKSGNFSDGEQGIIPVLSNRKLVTETLPMFVRGKKTKSFELEKLKNNKSKTLKNHRLTLEISSNPAWYALQSLPYLMELPYECSEQVFARFYANSLAENILTSNPQVKEVFELWKMQEASESGSSALLSNLEKNESLKSIFIEETPWIRDAQDETAQQKRIALFFDKNRLEDEQQRAIEKLAEMQLQEGGFPWFQKSSRPNRYITQHIATGFAQLQKMGVLNSKKADKIIANAIAYLDAEIVKDYKKLAERAQEVANNEKNKLRKKMALEEFWDNKHLNSIQIQYLYMRSYFEDLPMNTDLKKATAFYQSQAADYWNEVGLMEKGMIALLKHRDKTAAISEEILTSLKENSITSEALGMYWKSNKPGWHWSQSPIETQALLIEAFSEIEGDSAIVEELKIWLLKNKQTNRWETSKATSNAVYALLMNGTSWLQDSNKAEVVLGKEKVYPKKSETNSVEAGTGYFKTSWESAAINAEKAEVTISKKSESPSWGALYWQYFEDFKKITASQTSLQVSKEVFKKTNNVSGKSLKAISKDHPLEVGDLATIRLVIKTDRPMEFVHLKDDRASCFEPVNTLSGYKYQDGFSYYESTKDAASNFFIDYLPKGIFVFEYDVRVNNSGNFTSGIATIQNMYAPAFSAHSKGLRLDVE
jgi:uncharacterized protein YfaS (alpha-2-macroglobulin family)